MAVILPFEEELYRRTGIPVVFAGHPMLDEAFAGARVKNAPERSDGPIPVMLSGKPPAGVPAYVPEDGSYMKIKTDKTEVCFDTEGDCCSHTYYHEIFGVPEGNILELDSAGNIPDMQPGDPDENAECIQQYGLDIRTTKGVITVVYRNSSNGYYGGSSSRIDRVPNVKWLKQTGKD